MYLDKETINIPLPPAEYFTSAQLRMLHNSQADFISSVEFLHAAIKYMVDNHCEKFKISHKQTIFVFDNSDVEIWIESNKNRRGFRFQIIEPEPEILPDEEYITRCKLSHLVRQHQIICEKS